ncbi:hypothetical protein BGZ49_008642 [Haplosporangium sp. Z 27]|nr:hypothetical protein BGZ49_008642 [Haplosporangium sp. Z 27]
MSFLHSPTSSNPKILIIGAGLGGLTLAILLEKANINYEVYERCTNIRPLGSNISLHTAVLPLLDQLGLMDDLKKISKKAKGYYFYQETPDGEALERIGGADAKRFESVTGYHPILMSRPELHALLLSRVPKHKIHFGKRVLSMTQSSRNGVLIRTSDGKTHEGDILVGSDGAYSGVRQSLYQQLLKEGVLPSSDAEELKVCHLSILGTTSALDPAIVPIVEDELAHCVSIMGYHKPHSWRFFSIPGNRICWRVDMQLESTSFDKSDAFRNSEWGSAESSDFIDADLRAFKLPLGVNGKYLSVGDLIDNTELENISKVMLEEKLYTTWYHRRTVLMGDACHKMLPNAGKGAVNAMLDAVALANALYEIADNATPENIHLAFKEYYRERYAHAKQDQALSQHAAALLAGQTWKDAFRRTLVFKVFPSFLGQSGTKPKATAYRPQATFIPRVENRGSGHPKPQRISQRYERLKAIQSQTEEHMLL